MSGDHVTGIAVVDPEFKIDGVVRICLSLFYRETSKVKPCTLLFHDINNHSHSIDDLQKKLQAPIWGYRKDDPRQGWLRCQPSVRQMVGDREVFHNSFEWQVQYVMLRYSACDALFNIWKILNQWGTDENGGALPQVTAETFSTLRREKYIY